VNQPRELHTHIRMRIELGLGNRSWSWLSRTAGVPQSTLASQAGKPKFSVQVLLRVASALEKDVNYFLPDEMRQDPGGGAAEDAIDRIADIIWRAQRGGPP
jgi:hypothetical protein